MPQLTELFQLHKEQLPQVRSEEIVRYERYLKLLTEWNLKFNLVSKASLENAFSAHFVDSIFICDFAKRHLMGAIMDVGSGAGFPGIVYSIRNSSSITLFERTGKKRAFLEAVKNELKLDIEIQGDFEKSVKPVTLMARAVRPPRELLEHLSKRVQKGTRLIVPFGLKDNPSEIKHKSFGLVGLGKYDLPGADIHRTVACYEFRST